MKLAKRSDIAPSLTLAMNTKAKELRAMGRDVISFAAGEPDFHTPDHIKTAGKAAIDGDKTYYTPASGIIELKKAIVEKLKRENGLEYDTGCISVNSGAKHSVFNTLAVTVQEGDEVIIPTPYWVSYSEMVKICGAEPVFVETTEETGFKMSPGMLKQALSDKTKALLLNSPCNPTGTVYGKEELRDLAGAVEQEDIIVISDEIYEKILYDGNEHVSIASFSDTVKNKTVVINGMSKAFSMTGWRIGYAAGPAEIIEAINKLQGHTSGNPTSISQWASLSGLEKDTKFMAGWVEEFLQRRNYILNELNTIEGVSCMKPGGAFYVFPNVQGLLNRSYKGRKVKTSLDLAYYLLDEGGIAVVPGAAFGSEGYIRISFATSMATIEEGMKRLRAAVSV